MPITLKNQAYIDGVYGARAVSLRSNVAKVALAALAVRKRADRVIWGGGELTFTVEARNQGAVALYGAVMDDRLDPARVTLVPGSVTVDRIPVAYRYNPTQGDLQVALPAIAPDGAAQVRFRVASRNGRGREVRNRASVSVDALTARSNTVVVRRAARHEIGGYCPRCGYRFRCPFGRCRICPRCGYWGCYIVRAW